MKAYDVIVIGGGIHGAGVAQAAAACGLSVALVERREQPGLETSSASSKLIHGGLRYLETAQFKLVYECLKERKLLLKNAPGLVALRHFYLPVYHSSKRRAVWIYLGLLVYWLLSGCSNTNRFKIVAKAQWPGLGIRNDGLTAVFRYNDGQTDDRLLTQAVLRSAQSLGCDLWLNADVLSVDGFADAGNTSNLYRVKLKTGQVLEGHTLVNAAGPWVNALAERIAGAPQHDIDWVQGTHLVLDRPALAHCFYCEAPQDGRAVFVLPWQGKTLVGTTERTVLSARAQPSPAEEEYLLTVYNHYFPQSPCGREHIVTAFAGVRVLPVDGLKHSANRRSRETVFTQDNPDQCRYVGIYGGKLTSYRATAEKVLNLLAPYLGAALGKMVPSPVPTYDLPLSYTDKANHTDKTKEE